MKSNAILVFLLMLQPAHAAILFDGTFDDHDFSDYHSFETLGKGFAAIDYGQGIPDRVELIAGAHGGRRVARISLASDDPPTAFGQRSEIVGFTEPLRTERWYAWAYFLPETWHPSRTTISQFHQWSDADDLSVQPTLSFQTQLDGTVVVHNAWDTNERTTSSSFQNRSLASYALEVGVWTSIALHVYWSPSDDGFMKIYRNGELLFSEQGHPNTFNDSVGPYFKMGLYEQERAGEGFQSIHMAGFVVGDSAESLTSISSVVPEPPVYTLMLAGIAMFGLGMSALKNYRNPSEQ